MNKILSSVLGRLSKGLTTSKALLYLVTSLVGAVSYAQTGTVLADGAIETPDIHIMKGVTASGGMIAWANGAYLEAAPARQTEHTRQFKNVISFYVDENNTTHFLNDFTASVDLTIEYKANPTALAFTLNKVLTLDYKKGEGQLSDVRQYIHFEGAEYVKVTVNSFTFPSASGSLDYRDILVLENTIQVARYFSMTALPFTINQPLNIPTGNTLASGNDALHVSWGIPVNSGHNAIQLEWAWLETDLESNYFVGGSFTPASAVQLLSEGATRVEISYASTSYKIPMLYDGAGKLHYRVRGVNFQPNGTRINGVWSLVHSVSFSGHDNKLNWQSTNSFAEEGKLKTVIQYYDGSLRARQTVTKDNVTDSTIIAESLYDREGRPVIQLLPAPGINNQIAYHKNLNKFNGQGDNQDFTEFFDWHTTSGSGTPAMQTTVGSSSNYYSPSNPNQSGFNKYVPDAEGYPYTVTRFYPDGSGRILSQSGVGTNMKMGSGKETKYYYGSPKQEELDALFGTEVGDKSHYFKNMVQDANGQMSVSYVDMHGRTIATALAGESPANLSPLNVTNAVFYPNQNHTTALTLNLLDSNTNIVKGNAVESITTLLVPYRTLYNFSYTLTPQSLSLPVCNSGSPVCYECLYDLEFTVIDESGDRELPVLIRKFSNLSPDFDSLCSSPTRLFLDSSNLAGPRVSTINFSDTLSAGSYIVRKTLTISEKSLEAFKANYLTKGVCNLNLTFLIDSVYQELKELTNCDNPVANPASCTTCVDSLGTPGDYQTRYLNTIGHQGAVSPTLQAQINAAYQEAKDNCDLLCGTATLETITKRDLMLADMMPVSGQYGQELIPLSGVGAKYHIYSTLYPSTQPFYQKPKDAAGLLSVYKTVLNDTDRVAHPLTDPSLYVTLNGMNTTKFEEVFMDNWAEALLPYHPEYSRLVFTETTLKSSYNWISTYNTPNTYAAAQMAGYIYTNSTNLTDPFFAVVGTAGKKSVMVSWLNNDYRSGMSLWQYAYYSAICASSPTLLGCGSPTSIPKFPPYSGLSTEQENRLWQKFKNLYLEARNQLMDAFIAEQRPLPGSDETDLVASGYLLRFPRDHRQQATQYGNNSENPGDWSFWPSTVGNPPTLPPNWNTAATQAASYTSQCQSYILQWKSWLLQCPALASHASREAILNSITGRMVDICRKGSDPAHPYGASTVSPSTPVDGSFRGFEQLIQHVFDSLGIAKTDQCNPYVIAYPKAYGQGTAVTTTLVTTIDSCNCDRFTQIKAEAVIAGKNPAILSSLNEYLQQQYGDTLTKPLFDGLNRCSEIGTVKIGNCDSLFLTITAPCDQDPCGIASRMAEVENKVLALEGDSIVVSQRALPPDQPQYCLEPYVWDPILQQCVLPGGGECPPGYIWDPWLQQCIDAGEGCPPGYVWDSWLGQCVPELDPDCEFQCFAGLKCDTLVIKQVVLEAPAVLPNFMQCGYVPESRCITCDQVKTLVAEFKTKFGAPYNTAPITGVLNLSSTQTAYNQNLARFLNYRTGFSFNWADYMRAIASTSCNLETGGVQTVICRDSKPLTDTTGIFVKEDPCQRTYDMALHMAQQIYEFRLQRLLADFEKRYRAKCMEAARQEVFTVSYIPKEYHYTLYYYDQAGNLVKTVPPSGVRPNYSSVFLADVKAKRTAGTTSVPAHLLPTQYRYNSLNQVVIQQSPDGGTSKFWYDKLGRLAVSQNAVQLAGTKYSYTVYDALGRITEVGQKQQATAMTQVISQNETSLANWLTGSGVRDQLTYTVYDEAYTPLVSDPDVAAGITQQNLRNRVSYSMVKNQSTDTWQYTATFYSYDAHGNVKKLLQDYKGVNGIPLTDRLKRINYSYDLVSGKVNEVAYQPGFKDAFYHRYNYDAENRLTEVETSRDKVYWEREAAYEYYKHGPLARIILGQQQVQGVDYAYTLQGWLKGVNSSSLNATLDMGMDGDVNGGATPVVARDIYGYALHYYEEGLAMDYKAIGLNTPFASAVNTEFRSLYNGNIAAMTVNNGGLKKGPGASTNSLPLLYNYRYDQLNRLVNMQAYKGLDEANNVWTPVAIDDYKERITYDPNGNIRSYIRYGSPSIAGKNKLMDSLNYVYYASKNQLQRVTDNTAYSAYYTEDIDNQATTNNYTYDAIGNLISDASENISSITWTVYGKIATITKNGNNISYTYDAGGNRITKTADGKTTLYVRDASGNVMSLYEIPVTDQITQKEVHLYGSSRLGMALAESKAAVPVILTGGFNDGGLRTLVRGEKVFELSNHLGNVLVTLTDKKIQVAKANPNQHQIDYYTADVVSASDYAPFGMGLVGRSFSSDKYRYGFNGKENDNEVYGLGNSINFGSRMYDPRIGRWFSIDPLREVYSSLSAYSYSANNPINIVDHEGNILKDKNGNIIATSTGTFSSSSMPLGYSIEKSTGSITSREVYRKYEVVKIYADDGTPIEALKLVESYVVVSKYDKKGNLLNTSKDDLAKHGFEAVSDCHGYTFAKGKLWINDDQVNTLLDHDGYTRNVSEGTADVAVFKKGGTVVHSAIRNKNGTYSNDAGILTVEKNVSLDKASRGLTDIKGKGNVEFADKKTADKQVDIKTGKVENGVRYTTESEVKKLIAPSSVPGTATKPKPTTSTPKFDFRIPPQGAAVNKTYVKPPTIIPPLKKP